MRQKQGIKKGLLISALVFLGLFLSFRFQSKRLQFACPQEAKATSVFPLPFNSIPSLRAILEVSGSMDIPPRDIGVQLLHKQENRPNSALLIQLSQVALDHIPAGNYHLKVTLSRADDNLVLATLDLDSTLQPGASIDFGQGKWDYACPECDTDHDHYNNLTEIMNGVFTAPSSGTLPTQWIASPSDASASGGNSHPDKPSLLRPAGISAMSPGPGGRVRVVGDPFSVQSAVYVTADLLNANGARKGRGEAYSRIDGSFDLMVDSGAEAGDQVLVYVITQKGLGEPQYDSSRADVGPHSKKMILLKELQGCR